MVSSIFSSKSAAHRERVRGLTVGLIARAAVFLPLVILLVLVNYIVDPAAIFTSDDTMRDIASRLLRNENVAILSDHNDRLLQKFYIEGLTERNEVVVFGSSRSHQIGERLFPGRTFHNNSVMASTLGDYIGLLELYREKGLLPRTVVLGVDPWIFNEHNHVETWRTLDIYTYNFFSFVGLYAGSPASSLLNDINTRVFKIYKYSQLLSISYFQSALQRLRSLARDDHKGSLLRVRYYPTGRTDLDADVELSDGSMLASRSSRMRENDEILRNVKAAFILGHFARQAFSRRDPKLTHEFEVFVKYLLREKIQVVIWLAPYHPYAYDILSASDKYSVINEVENYVRDFADGNGIPVIGSYGPKACGMTESDFSDAIHLKRESVNKMFASDLGGAGSGTARLG
ncbi:MAG: hypothetical protein HQL30_07855 [Candidatus Omnitrophica bacterium]|nr:hypothetical protein [Candidatus Omnitrophota bacterium]